MKKNLLFLGLAVLLAAVVFSCKKDDNDDDDKTVQASLIKTITVDYGDGVEGYEFMYDAGKKITGIKNTWEGELVDTFTYDYSVSGKLTITKEDWPTTYDLDASGRVTKEWWSDDEWAAYEYNADGYLIKIIEHWGGADHNKFDVEITNGNVTKHTRYGDDGVANRYKTFTYTAGDNVNDIQQANAVDSNWKTVGNLFGKPSKKLVDFLEYWNPGDEVNKKTTTITYTFDAKNRPATMVRAGDGWQEDYAFTYYE